MHRIDHRKPSDPDFSIMHSIIWPLRFICNAYTPNCGRMPEWIIVRFFQNIHDTNICIQYEPLPRFTHSSDCRIFTKNWTIHTVSFFLRLTPDETLVIWEDICTLHHLLVCTCLYKFDGKNSNLLVFVSNLWI